MLQKLCYKEAQYIYGEVFHKECTICHKNYATEKHDTYMGRYSTETVVYVIKPYATKKHDTETKELFHREH
jgi:hypothetical protein